ncbi:hypothetical protein [Levilactobacillus bambusae]|uniref:MapZ extracellular domain-containing protein n=1 Tax=Levilactobacillus bambusae TaxID=2024736 RepID=A0A2V1MXK0_9LACO|nr:hypothetical protein [Levilactobacillus bambusae]PWF99780.1 hypothetical protein DCM90_06885 [Levilactobacillus bambusae]
MLKVISNAIWQFLTKPLIDKPRLNHQTSQSNNDDVLLETKNGINEFIFVSRSDKFHSKKRKRNKQYKRWVFMIVFFLCIIVGSVIGFYRYSINMNITDTQHLIQRMYTKDNSDITAYANEKNLNKLRTRINNMPNNRATLKVKKEYTTLNSMVNITTQYQELLNKKGRLGQTVTQRKLNDILKQLSSQKVSGKHDFILKYEDKIIKDKKIIKHANEMHDLLHTEINEQNLSFITADQINAWKELLIYSNKSQLEHDDKIKLENLQDRLSGIA